MEILVENMHIFGEFFGREAQFVGSGILLDAELNVVVLVEKCGNVSGSADV